MTEPVRPTVQKRDGASIAVPPAADAVVTVPWVPRDMQGQRAILVSERSTVFDRPLPELAKQDEAPEIVSALGPLPTQWTWDLVHCRLLCAHAIASGLPRVQVPPTYRSFLGNLQPSDVARPMRRVLTDDDTRRFDWTMSRVDCWPDIDRIVLKGIMSGHSLAEVSVATIGWARRFGGAAGLKKSAVHKRYRTDTTIMAAEWAAADEPIDYDTRACWLNGASGSK